MVVVNRRMWYAGGKKTAVISYQSTIRPYKKEVFQLGYGVAGIVEKQKKECGPHLLRQSTWGVVGCVLSGVLFVAVWLAVRAWAGRSEE